MRRSFSQKPHTKIIDPLTKLTDNTTQALKIGVHWVNIYRRFKASCEPGSLVGIETGYGLDGPGIESRWRGEIFRTCPDRPWGPPSLLYKGYRVSPGDKERPGRDADPSPPSSAVVKKE